MFDSGVDKIYFGINGQFGDIIIQEPCLRSIIEDNPHIKIIMGCNKRYAGALQLYKNYHSNIIDFIIWEGYTTRCRPPNQWPTEKDKKYIEDNLKNCPMFDVSPIHTQKDWAKSMHQTESFANTYGIELKSKQIKLNRPSGIKKRQKTVAISLFPNWPNGGPKAFSTDSVANIVACVNKLGYKVIHLNGPDEPDIPQARKLNGTYLESTKALLGTDLLITGDTGMSWVASAFQHPTLGFYAWGYNPVAKTSKNWQPVNPNAEYLEAFSVSDISKKDILSAIHRRLK